MDLAEVRPIHGRASNVVRRMDRAGVTAKILECIEHHRPIVGAGWRFPGRICDVVIAGSQPGLPSGDVCGSHGIDPEHRHSAGIAGNGGQQHQSDVDAAIEAADHLADGIHFRLTLRDAARPPLIIGRPVGRVVENDQHVRVASAAAGRTDENVDILGHCAKRQQGKAAA